MNPSLLALGIVTVVLWIGIWLYLFGLQRRLDRIDRNDPPSDS